MKGKQMRYMYALLIFFLFPIALVAGGCSLSRGSLGAELVADGFTAPLFVCSQPGDADRLYVVEQGGKIWIISGGVPLPIPFLDISGLISSGSERGLLGLAFHPDYGLNGFFYVNYTEKTRGETVVARYQRSGDDENSADPTSGYTVLTIPQPFANHNGGMIAFGPDRYLYIASGDGGGANDPDGNGQNLATLLGKILRIDVDLEAPYAVPPDNPFKVQPGTREEIWAYGLRNPWRFSFDTSTGDIYIGDVGQDAREEIDFQAAASLGGENYGWDIAEGIACQGGSGTCGLSPLYAAPVYDYDHRSGESITGGYVYRGAAIETFRGYYLFGDFVSGRVWSFKLEGGVPVDLTEHTRDLTPAGGRSIGAISSFGEDASGELYIVDYSDGEIYKVVPRA